MTAREDKEKIKTAREELGKYFYDLSKLIFTSTVLTNSTAIFGLTDFTWKSMSFIVVGFIGTWACASMGNKILKK